MSPSSPRQNRPRKKPARSSEQSLDYSSLQMGSTCSFEKLDGFQRTSWRYIPEDISFPYGRGAPGEENIVHVLSSLSLLRLSEEPDPLLYIVCYILMMADKGRNM
jgi:hypothetical protein